MPHESTMATKKKKSSKARTSQTSPTKNPWGTTIRISWELHELILSKGKFGESFNEVLSRLLKAS